MGKLLNLLQDLLLLYVQYGGLGGSKRAALGASISYHIKKFLTIPLIRKIITSYFYAHTHIKTLHKMNPRLHPPHHNPAAWGKEGGAAPKHSAARFSPGKGKFVVV